MTDDRDRQRSKVYAWEERFIAARDPTSIAFAQAQRMVDAIWAEFGLRFPPKVEHLPRQARSTVADATWLSIRLPRQVRSGGFCMRSLLRRAGSFETATADQSNVVRLK